MRCATESAAAGEAFNFNKADYLLTIRVDSFNDRMEERKLASLGKTIRARTIELNARAASIRAERRIFNFRYGSAAHWIQVFRDYYGPTMNAFEAAARAGRRDELEAQLGVLFRSENRALGKGTEIPATYLRVLVAR